MAKALWLKAEPILWFLESIYLLIMAYGLLLRPAKFWALPLWSRLLTYFVLGFWWTGFRNRLAKFLRDSLREMIVQELAESRMAFVTWLREDAPWRGENPFYPPGHRGAVNSQEGAGQNLER